MSGTEREICGPLGTHLRQIESSQAVTEAMRVTEIQLSRAGPYPSNVRLRQLREAFQCPKCWEAQIKRLADEVPGYNFYMHHLLLTEAHTQ